MSRFWVDFVFAALWLALCAFTGNASAYLVMGESLW